MKLITIILDTQAGKQIAIGLIMGLILFIFSSLRKRFNKDK
jgi:hypothetical protein